MKQIACIIGFAVLAAGCENASVEGVHAEVSAQGRNGVAPETVMNQSRSPATPADPGTWFEVDAPSSEQDHDVYRSDGMKVEVEFAALNLQLVSVDPCPTVAAMLERAGGFLLGSAFAHGSAIETGSSALHLLDEPVALGRLDLEPGTYCGVTLEIVPGSDPLPDYAALAAAADPDIPLYSVTTTDTHGIGLNLSACFYYPSQGAERESAYNESVHTCLANIRTIREPVTVELQFDEPVTVDADHRHLGATLSVRYDRWFENIEMDNEAGVGGQIVRWSSENPNPMRPYGSGSRQKDVDPDTGLQCSVDAGCAAEFERFIEALVDNVRNPENFEITLTTGD